MSVVRSVQSAHVGAFPARYVGEGGSDSTGRIAFRGLRSETNDHSLVFTALPSKKL